jgi:hypothetical protein
VTGIYKITNPSGKVYIGQSWDINGRKYRYKKLLCKDQPAIFNSLKKYGWEKHCFSVLYELPEDVSQSVLDEYEIFYWKQHIACSFKMLNAKEPGKGGKHLIETKQKISTTKIGSKHSEQTKQKISNTLKGRPAITSKKAVLQYTREGRFINEFDSQSAAAHSLDVKSSAAICECCQGKRKSYKGFIWKYKLNML